MRAVGRTSDGGRLVMLLTNRWLINSVSGHGAGPARHIYTCCLPVCCCACAGEEPGEIDLFVRELVSPNMTRRTLPYLLFLQGAGKGLGPAARRRSRWGCHR